MSTAQWFDWASAQASSAAFRDASVPFTGTRMRDELLLACLGPWRGGNEQARAVRTPSAHRVIAAARAPVDDRESARGRSPEDRSPFRSSAARRLAPRGSVRVSMAISITVSSTLLGRSRRRAPGSAPASTWAIALSSSKALRRAIRLAVSQHGHRETARAAEHAGETRREAAAWPSRLASTSSRSSPATKPCAS